ncbi:MAG: hypothetical protein Aurels2KO_49610 [Aureliella sp.]
MAAGLAGLACATGLPGSQRGGALAGEPRKWPVELSIGQFQVHSDVADFDKHLIESELLSVAADVTNVLKLQPSKEKVYVVLFGTQKAYRQYMQAYFPTLPARRALFIQDRGPGMLFAHWSDDVQADLRHEVVHGLVNASGTALPLWLDEGIAEYFEAQPGSRFDGNTHLSEVVDRAVRGVVPKLDELDRITDLHDFTGAHYRDSWSWVHFMLHRNRIARRLIIRFLSDHRGGAKTAPLSQQLTRTIPKLSDEYCDHFSHFNSIASGSRADQSAG